MAEANLRKEVPMHRFAIFVGFTLSTVALAGSLVGSNASLRTRDGKTRTGKVLSETGEGYLLRTPTETVLVAYASIEEISPESTERPASAAAVPHAAAPAPTADASTAAPSAFSIGVSARLGGFANPSTSTRDTSLTFAGAAATSWYSSVVGLPLDYRLNRVSLRATPLVGALAVSTTLSSGRGSDHRIDWSALFGLDAELRVHLSPRLTTGLGITQGLVAGVAAQYFVGPSLTLLDVRLGRQGQHELGLRGVLPFAPREGVFYHMVPMVQLSYGYVL